jgi:Macrocin-O-methyltransferase (TylF)
MDYSLGINHNAHGVNYPLLRHVLSLSLSGSAIEFGVGSGTSLSIIADVMPVIGFDSFQGLPEDWRYKYPAGSMLCEKPDDIDNSKIVVGLFSDTLPGFDFKSVGQIGLIHFDADLYSSTKDALDYIGPYISSGTVCLFDEWRGYKQCKEHEQRAWREYVSENQLNWNVIGHAEQAWAVRIT